MRRWVLRVCLFAFNVLGVVIPVQERAIAFLGWAVDTERQALEYLRKVIMELVGPPPTPPEG